MSCSNYKTLSEGYLDNTGYVEFYKPRKPDDPNRGPKPKPTIDPRKSDPKPMPKPTPPPRIPESGRNPAVVVAAAVPATVPPIVVVTPEMVDGFLKFVFSDNPDIWSDCFPAQMLSQSGSNPFYPAVNIIKQLEREYGLEIDSFFLKEKEQSISIIKLCSSNTILNNKVMDEGSRIMKGYNGGELLPFTHTNFNVDIDTKKRIFNNLLTFLNNQLWTSCDTDDMFQQFVSECEFDLMTNFSNLYNFDNSKPHIFQVIDMLRPMLKLKFEINYNSTTGKIIFSRFCKANVMAKIVPNL